MSDRWKDELKKLRGVQPPDGLWDRAKQPPSADRLPPRRERIVAGVVAISVFVAAGAFAFQALRPGGTQRTISGTDSAAVMRLDAYPFEATLTFAGSVEHGVRGNSIWTLDNGMTQTDNPFGLGVQAYLSIPAGTEITIRGNVVDVQGWFETRSGDVAGAFGEPNQRDLDLPSGRYVLHVHARWARGVADFDFGIEVVQSSKTPPPTEGLEVPEVARVVCDEAGIEVLTPVVAAQSDGVHLVFDNRSGAEAFELHSVTSADGTTAGGKLKASGETKSGGFSIEPGELQVACLPGTNDSYLNQPSASLTVEDPNGLWIPTELSCGDATVETTGAIENVYGLPDDEVERAIRDATVGLAESDEVLKPGYPGTHWMTVILVVRRADAIVARIEDVSGFKIEACDGSGIAAVPTLDIPLVCGVADQIAFEHTGGVDEPAGEAFIRVNTIGILPSDALTHTGPASGPTGDDGIWTVTRDGSVIAWVDYPDLNGVACMGTGVGAVAGS